MRKVGVEYSAPASDVSLAAAGEALCGRSLANEHSQSGWYQEAPRMGAHGIRPIDILYQKPSTSTSTSTITGFVNGPGVFTPRPT